MAEPIRGIKPIKRLFELAPKVTGTNCKAIRAVIRRLKRRYKKLLDGAYSGYAEFHDLHTEIEDMEFELHFRREIDRFVKSGSPSPEEQVLNLMYKFWHAAAAKFKVTTFDHTHVGAYFWGKGATVQNESCPENELSKANDRVVDMMIAYKIIKAWEEWGRVKSELRPIEHGGQLVSFMFVY